MPTKRTLSLQIPVGLGYYHHAPEYFLAYNGAIYSDPGVRPADVTTAAGDVMALAYGLLLCAVTRRCLTPRTVLLFNFQIAAG